MNFAVTHTGPRATRRQGTRRHRAAGCAAALLAAWSSLLPLAEAGQFGLAPMEVELGPQARTAAIRVFNSDKVPLSFQVDGFAWSQDEAGDPLQTPTSDLVFFPRLLTVGPGEEGVVRVGLRQPLVAREQTFLMYVTERPTPAQDGSAGSSLQLLLRVGAPVFVRPVKETYQLEWGAASLQGGGARFTLRNTGTRHQLLEEVELNAFDTRGTVVFNTLIKTSSHLLAGATRQLEAALPPADCRRVARLELTVKTNRTQTRQQLAAGTQGCS